MTNSIESFSASLSLLLLGLAVQLVVRVMYAARQRPPEDTVHLLLQVVGCVLLVVSGLNLTYLLLSLLSLPLAVAAVMVAAVVARRYWLSRRRVLLNLLAVVAERQVPLASAVEALAQETSGSFGRRLRRLADQLAAGIMLPDALRSVRGLTSRAARATIEVGWSLGAPASAFRTAAEAHRLPGAIQEASAAFTYLACLSLVMASLIFFAVYKVVPAIVKIAEDFDAELPAPTLMLIDASNLFMEYWWMFSPLGMAFCALLASWALSDLELLGFDLPLMGRLMRRREIARILRSLALVAETGQPLSLGIATLARCQPFGFLRTRLTKAQRDVEAGVPWSESLLRRGLVRPAEAAVLQSAERVGNLAWALRDMADSAERRLGYRLKAWLQVLFPCALFALGMVLLLVVVGLFLPMIAFVQKWIP